MDENLLSANEEEPRDLEIEESIDLGSEEISNRNKRAEIEKKIEAKRRQEEEEFSFKPKLYEFRSSKEPNKSGSRFEKLYKDAQKRHSDFSEKLSASEAISPTFQPVLISRPIDKNKRPASPSGLISRLYSSSGAGNCMASAPERPSFQPQITQRAKSTDRGQANVSQRLFQSSLQAREKIEKKKAEADAKAVVECTFSPKLNPNTRSLSANRAMRSIPGGGSGVSVTERLIRYDEQKNTRLSELRQAKQAEEDAAATFTPSINRWATPIDQRPVYERLSDLVPPTVVDPMEAELTFKPQITKVAQLLEVR